MEPLKREKNLSEPDNPGASTSLMSLGDAEPAEAFIDNPLKLFDSEIRLMELIWANAPVHAKQLSGLAREKIGWNKNTTYTILKKLVAKKAVMREEPGFLCTPAVSRPQVQQAETDTLIRKLFQGSRKAFLSAFLQDGKMTDGEVEMLRDMIERDGKQASIDETPGPA
jgi:BlaI family penicillinase repressor